MSVELIKQILWAVVISPKILKSHNMIFRLLNSEIKEGFWDITIEVYTTHFPVPDKLRDQLELLEKLDADMSFNFHCLYKTEPGILSEIVSFVNFTKETTKSNLFLI